MNVAETISVNPGQKTLGALHPEAVARFLRTTEFRNNNTSSQKMWMRLTFAASVPGVKRYSGALLVLRLLLSAIFIVSGSFILSGEIYSPSSPLTSFALGLGEIIVGSMLATGFLSRFAMLAATALFATMSVESIMAGIFDMQSLMCCMLSVIFLVLGAGRYSFDYLLRRAIIRHAIKRRRHREAMRLTYRAYQYQ